jgi:hypothetical protein
VFGLFPSFLLATAAFRAEPLPYSISPYAYWIELLSFPGVYFGISLHYHALLIRATEEDLINDFLSRMPV